MKHRYLIVSAVLVTIAIIAIACTSSPPPTPVIQEVTREVEVTRVVEAQPAVQVPYLDLWQGSGHADVAAEAFVHWNEDSPAEIPVSCARCHAAAGYQDYLGVDGSEALKVDAAVPAPGNPGIVCVACHNPVTTFQLNSVQFPGKDDEGETITITGLGDAARCMICHQGRASKASVDAQIERFKVADVDAVVAPIKDDQGNNVNFGFINIHYFAAAATLYGTEVKGGYEYEGKMYDAKFRHVEGYDSCIGCHNPHTLEIKVNECAACHEGVANVEDLKSVRMVSSAKDYDGDGDAEEGIASEIAGLQEVLLAEIQKYATDTAGAEIKYDSATYPYFMGADGKAYPNWTARLLKAAYNYQVSVKDPGKYAHGGKYIIQLMYDSIEDLGGDVSALAREDAGHFAGNTEAFRHWDAEGVVPGSCARCHSASGLPQFLKEGTTISNPLSNGFMCSTCHDSAAFPERYAVASVTFPSGKVVSFGGQDANGAFVADDSNLCIECHQGRESKRSVDSSLARFTDADAPTADIRFRNIHYFAAGGTLFGTDVQAAYEYDGKTYRGQNVEHPLNKCADCHDVHALQPKVETCAGCHGGAEPQDTRGPTDTVDYDGDGDAAEGMKGEIDTLAEALYAEIQAYAADAGTPILYSATTYPYFFVDADQDGQPDKNDQGANVGYNAWTPRLLKAGYNYQYVQKDPGNYVHNPRYVIQFVIDSIADLGGDVSAYTRP